MIHVRRIAIVLVFGLLSVSVAAEPTTRPASPHVVFVTGDHEYRSEITMPMFARLLEARHGMRCTVCYAVDEATGQRDPQHETNIAGLEALETADLMVIFVRFRRLPDEQLQRILDYVDSGRPIVGLRTSTHAFRYAGGPNAKWNDGFGRDVFGQKWITHHGHDSSTNVFVAAQDHPITRGVEPRFHCRSWLYNVMPLHGDCMPLLIGAAVKGPEPQEAIFGTPNPVAWTKHYKQSRVFFTTLGHPEDFTHEAVRRLLVNGIYWALQMEDRIPAGGLDVTLTEAFVPPATK